MFPLAAGAALELKYGIWENNRRFHQFCSDLSFYLPMRRDRARMKDVLMTPMALIRIGSVCDW